MSKIGKQRAAGYLQRVAKGSDFIAIQDAGRGPLDSPSTLTRPASQQPLITQKIQRLHPSPPALLRRLPDHIAGGASPVT